MGRYYWNKKEEADGLKKITVFRLKEWGYLKRQYGGTITWTNNWNGDQSRVGIEVVFSEYEKYLRIHYTQTEYSTGEKTNHDYRIPLVTTPCHLGGERYWFMCPWYANGVYCGKRVGTLYLGGKYFACRHCYNLSYASKNENRKSSLFPFGQFLGLENKIEKLEEKIKTRFYNGRPTRKYRRLQKLELRCYSEGMRSSLEEMAEVLKR